MRAAGRTPHSSLARPERSVNTQVAAIRASQAEPVKHQPSTDVKHQPRLDNQLAGLP
ncbi:MAG: hypothetical protein QOG10_7188, partial [Kribbellaceae bacterium]|nr:hypothetical protein [Kribbellaceae bacterium]